MELQHLRVFLVVAEELHFGRAAARLHLAQPPVTRSIQHLERELGVTLFDRSHRAVHLTAAGEALVQPARAVLDAVERVSSAVTASRSGVVGHVPGRVRRSVDQDPGGAAGQLGAPAGSRHRDALA